jgi:hypothetical protein
MDDASAMRLCSHAVQCSRQSSSHRDRIDHGSNRGVPQHETRSHTCPSDQLLKFGPREWRVTLGHEQER